MATKTTANRSATQDAIDAGAGILRLEPCWVPRTFMVPGRRLRLHPDDLYALGAHRGGINERWFSSTTHASNGPGTPDDEGLSYVRLDKGGRVLLKALVDEGGSQFLTFSIPVASAYADQPYRFVVPGVEGAEVAVEVP